MATLDKGKQSRDQNTHPNPLMKTPQPGTEKTEREGPKKAKDKNQIKPQVELIRATKAEAKAKWNEKKTIQHPARII